MSRVEATPTPAPGAGRGAEGGGEPDPGLALMLAQQAATQWHFDAGRLEASADRGGDRTPVADEADALAGQVRALRERLEPLAGHADLAIRFETQELLAALETIDARLARTVRRLRPEAPWRDPAQVFAALAERRH